MRKKIIGILVCMLVIATCLPATGKIDIKRVNSNDNVRTTPFGKVNIISLFVYQIFM
jgi:hypothetical protein